MTLRLDAELVSREKRRVDAIEKERCTKKVFAGLRECFHWDYSLNKHRPHTGPCYKKEVDEVLLLARKAAREIAITTGQQSATPGYYARHWQRFLYLRLTMHWIQGIQRIMEIDRAGHMEVWHTFNVRCPLCEHDCRLLRPGQRCGTKFKYASTLKDHVDRDHLLQTFRWCFKCHPSSKYRAIPDLLKHRHEQHGVPHQHRPERCIHLAEPATSDA